LGVVEQGACVYGPPQLTLASNSVTVPTCHENGTQAWVENYTCKDDLRGVINVCRTATCPAPTACYYTVSGQDKEAKCENKNGGPWFPTINGLYGKWVDSNQEHCKFPVPGIWTDFGNDFNLVPGQSHPDCQSH